MIDRRTFIAATASAPCAGAWSVAGAAFSWRNGHRPRCPGDRRMERAGSEQPQRCSIDQYQSVVANGLAMICQGVLLTYAGFHPRFAARLRSWRRLKDCPQG